MLGFILSFLLGFVPMFLFAALIYWLDRYEKEPFVLLGVVFTWGAVIAAGIAYLLDTIIGLGMYFLTHSQPAIDLTTGSIVAPVVEETLKGMAVFFIFLIFRQEFDTIMDGIVFAAITALGFAATENVYYIYTLGYQEGGIPGLLGMAFVRIVLVGWQHPFYTAFTGIGLATARLSSKSSVRWTAPFIGWGLAIITHAFHNTLASALSGTASLAISAAWDWTGWLVMFLYILWSLNRERLWIKTYLKDEMAQGLITPEQYQTACSAWRLSRARIASLFNGTFGNTNRFYQTCADLAFKKYRLATLGEGKTSPAQIEALREKLEALSPLSLAI